MLACITTFLLLRLPFCMARCTTTYNGRGTKKAVCKYVVGGEKKSALSEREKSGKGVFAGKEKVYFFGGEIAFEQDDTKGR